MRSGVRECDTNYANTSRCIIQYLGEELVVVCALAGMARHQKIFSSKCIQVCVRLVKQMTGHRLPCSRGLKMGSRF